MNKEKAEKRLKRASERNLSEQLGSVLAQCEILAFTNSQLLGHMMKQGFDMVKPMDAARLTRALVTVMDIQIRASALLETQREIDDLPGPRILWDVLCEMPGVGPFFRRDRFRAELRDRLKAAIDAVEPVEDKKEEVLHAAKTVLPIGQESGPSEER